MTDPRIGAAMSDISDAELIMKVDGLLAKIHQDILPNAELSRLIALARIGAAVTPRPIEEAPKDGQVLLDTSGRRFIWGSIRGEHGFKWTDRADWETPWATTVGYFYYVAALPSPKEKI